MINVTIPVDQISRSRADRTPSVAAEQRKWYEETVTYRAARRNLGALRGHMLINTQTPSSERPRPFQS